MALHESQATNNRGKSAPINSIEKRNLYDADKEVYFPIVINPRNGPELDLLAVLLKKFTSLFHPLNHRPNDMTSCPAAGPRSESSLLTVCSEESEEY